MHILHRIVLYLIKFSNVRSREPSKNLVENNSVVSIFASGIILQHLYVQRIIQILNFNNQFNITVDRNHVLYLFYLFVIKLKNESSSRVPSFINNNKIHVMNKRYCEVLDFSIFSYIGTNCIVWHVIAFVFSTWLDSSTTFDIILQYL